MLSDLLQVGAKVRLKSPKKMPVSPQFITYTLIGGLSVSTDVLSFALLYRIFKTPLVNVASYFIGTVTSFTLNRSLNFNVTNKTPVRFTKFLIVSLFGILWSTLLINWLSAYIPAVMAKIATLPLVLMYQYLLSKHWVYNVTK